MSISNTTNTKLLLDWPISWRSVGRFQWNVSIKFPNFTHGHWNDAQHCESNESNLLLPIGWIEFGWNEQNRFVNLWFFAEFHTTELANGPETTGRSTCVHPGPWMKEARHHPPTRWKPPHPCPTGHPPKWVGSWSRPVGGGCRWPPRDAVGRPVALLAAAHRPPPTSCQAYGKQVKLGLNDHFHLFNSLSACYVLSFNLTFEIFNIYPIHLMTL